MPPLAGFGTACVRARADHVLNAIGADEIAGFVPKPYRLKTLEAAVERILGVVDTR